MIGFMMARALLMALIAAHPALAHHFFDTPRSIVIGKAIPGYAAQSIKTYNSYAAYLADATPHSFVGYDNESWVATPLNERLNPTAYMAAFAELAHARGAKVMLMPARDLLGVPGTLWTSYLADAPQAASVADVYEIQAQALQTKGVAAYASFVKSAVGNAKPGQPKWAGLTTDRAGDTAAQMFACYEATKGEVSGYWLNSTSATLPIVVRFLREVRAAGG